MLDFVIPSSKDDLLSDHNDRYVPRNIVGPNVLVRQYSECNNAIRNDGYKFILEHFDTLASYLIHFQKLSWDDTLKGWNVIYGAVNAMTTELKELLLGNHELECEVRQPAANAVKMIMYLATQTIMAFEDRVKRINENRIKKRGMANTCPEQLQWQSEVAVAVKLLHDVLHLPLVWLWDPPVPSTEESFFHLVGNMSLAVLENSAITTTKLSDVKEAVLHILGILVKRYNYKISIIFRLMDMLTQSEQGAPVIAQAVALLHGEYGCTSIVREMVKEVVEAHSGEVLPQAARNHGQFLSELGSLSPAPLKELLPVMLPLLESPHVSVRNGVLSAMSAVIVKCLSSDTMMVADRRQRDELLDVLLDYVYDSNAFVRAKVVALWRRLLEEGAVPQGARCEVLEAVGGRILDSASSVRRAAIQLTTLFLQQNPASAKMGQDALLTQLEVEKTKLKEMHDRYREGNPRDMQWLQMQPLVAVDLQEYFEEMQNTEGNCESLGCGSGGSSEDNGEQDEEEESDDLLQRIHLELCKALDKKRVIKAYKCVKRIEHLAPSYLSVAVEMDISAKVDFYISTLGFFYKYETLTKEALTQSLVQGQPDQEEKENLKAQEVYVDYLEGCLLFVQQLCAALSRLEDMLQWAVANPGVANDGSVADAVCLVQAAHAAGVPGADRCMRTVLQLLLHEPESVVVEAVAEGAKAVYFDYEKGEGLSKHERVVASLMKLLGQLTMGEARALEILVKQWVKSKDLPGGCVQVMWEFFLHPEQVLGSVDPRRKRLLALALLQMTGPALPDRVRALAPEIAEHVFVKAQAGHDAEVTLEAAAEACAVLASTCPPLVHNHTAPVSAVRLPHNHEVFSTLSALVVRAFESEQTDDEHLVTLSTQAVNLAFAFCLSPEPFVEGLVRMMLKNLKAHKPFTLDCESPSSTQGRTGSSQPFAVPSRALGRFLALSGHIAMMQMVFLDTAVYSKIKALEESDKLKKAPGRAAKRCPAPRNKGSGKGSSKDCPPSPGSTVSSMSTSSSVPEAEEGTQAEDRVSESIRLVCEMELFHPDHLLGKILPVVVAVVSKPKTYKDPILQRAAVLALAKMMMVSSTVCQNNMQLFVTVMCQSTDPDTRAQAVIAIADITLRFPNAVEPWSKHIYARLQDCSELVRLTTIFILSRLVMCDMIKVRGQISDLALCICDANVSIADAARSFFLELSQKHNVLYNVLPDIISGLCSSSLPENKFHEITAFVFGLIKKEKQIEVLVEKLCQRFHLANDDRQASDLAYCLTLLSYNPKSLTRLTDLLALYADKLHIPKVYGYFQNIASTYSKPTVKPETKTVAEELYAAIEQILQARPEDEEGEVRLPFRRTRGQKTPRNVRSGLRGKGGTPASATATGTTRRKTVRKVQWSSSSEDGENHMPDIAESL